MLQHLTERQYRAAVLRWGAGKTIRAIARDMGIDRKGVYEHLAAVMRRYPSLHPVAKGRRRTGRLSAAA